MVHVVSAHWSDTFFTLVTFAPETSQEINSFRLVVNLSSVKKYFHAGIATPSLSTADSNVKLVAHVAITDVGFVLKSAIIFPRVLTIFRLLMMT